MQNMEKNLNRVRARIIEAARASGRDPDSILLLAVSKKKPASDIRLAYGLGQRDFGENYLQEAQQKLRELQDLDICWHFIGAIQSNKTHSIAEAFDWVHCIDRVKIARRLSEQRPAGRQPLNVCIQVNLDQESSKAGIEPEALPELAVEIRDLPGIRLRGLMTIPAPRDTPRQQRIPFARLAEMLSGLRQQGIDCDTLSMGMTQDLEAAIAEGSTLVRIGTAIFGERT
ncbi:MAG TPA: YggS family pyridoxal phosphate-dependent enzyme [Gammaproteobacteria bacterium]|nr:YggS family pyridoxal phosphate-dependent enzyme [Gammaproteobacteria bacterium]